MKNNTNCIFCNKPTSTYHNCRVCNSCKTVSNFSLSSAELFDEVRNCIDSIQRYIVGISEMLHDIEGRYINHGLLSSKEQRIRDFCVSFQSCRKELELMIENHINSGDIGFRMGLYKLLELSADWVNNRITQEMSHKTDRLMD